MKDFTSGPIHRHIISMAIPIAINMLVQTLANLIDVFFVGRLGDNELAGVSAAGNFQFLNMLFTQVLFVGSMTLVAHAIGKKDIKTAESIYSHGMFYGLIVALLVFMLGNVFCGDLLDYVLNDAIAQNFALDYLKWFIPFLSLQVIYTVIVGPLYGAGMAKPFTSIQLKSQCVNVVLSPTLINGIPGLIPSMGVEGAALASLISGVVAIVLVIKYLRSQQNQLTLHLDKIRPNWDIFKRTLKIGLPSGGEFLISFISMTMVYWMLSRFGVMGQAGFGLGAKVAQSLFLPAMAISLASPAIAAQNFSARQFDRVRKTYVVTALMSMSAMFVLMLVCVLLPDSLVYFFSHDEAVRAVAAEYLSYIGFSFPALGLIFTISGMLQALGNTSPSFISSAIKLAILSALLSYFAYQPDFVIADVWWAVIIATLFQSILNVMILKVYFIKKLR